MCFGGSAPAPPPPPPLPPAPPPPLPPKQPVPPPAPVDVEGPPAPVKPAATGGGAQQDRPQLTMNPSTMADPNKNLNAGKPGPAGGIN